MLMKGITLRGLEVFEALASSGSVAQAAALTGLSQPAVSQQLRNLEAALGADLVDHGKRPMRLTPAGVNFLTRTEAALSELRQAQSDLTVMDLAHLTALSIGIIDDFDDNVTPRFATILADSLTSCRFKLITASSNDLHAAIVEKRLHLAISASSDSVPDGSVEYPLTHDPFMVVTPKGVDINLQNLAVQTGLPLLRYEKEQMISQLIETQLSRHGITCAERFEVGSHLALMAMVARGIGWAITTPLGYMRAARFHDQVEAHPLPFEAFSRRISLFASADWAGEVPQDLARTMRQLIQRHMIDPAIAQQPWLAGDFRILQP